MTLNGANWANLWIPFGTLSGGAKLNFVLSGTASTWGSAATNAPPSYTHGSLRYEAESLAIQAYAGPEYQTVHDARYSAGSAVELDSTSAGNYITYVVPNVPTGKYDVRIGVQQSNSRGIWQLSIAPAGDPNNGPRLGSQQDGYSSSPAGAVTELDLGTWTPSKTCSEAFKFAITGKNAASTGYGEVIDYITLIPH